jgi:hypothetical protein
MCSKPTALTYVRRAILTRAGSAKSMKFSNISFFLQHEPLMQTAQESRNKAQSRRRLGRSPYSIDQMRHTDTNTVQNEGPYIVELNGDEDEWGSYSRPCDSYVQRAATLFTTGAARFSDTVQPASQAGDILITCTFAR